MPAPWLTAYVPGAIFARMFGRRGHCGSNWSWTDPVASASAILRADENTTTKKS
jgi:hypothetical protein